MQNHYRQLKLLPVFILPLHGTLLGHQSAVVDIDLS